MDGPNILIFGLGVLLISVVIAISFSVARINQFRCFILRVILALGAAAIGAGISGFLNLQVAGVLRAGGALGIFVLVYTVNPPSAIRRGKSTKHVARIASDLAGATKQQEDI